MVECESLSYHLIVFAKNRFNRYMVECESWTPPLLLSNTNVLIDTWWNVNISAKDVVNNAIHVLIDTWWNVN